ncbi:hypothetical protein A3L09_03950 [Thermococcus profundus]|uniref:Uncharacterized protein n=1 Tax=Thermococcus profundus TaxID=49899 RepID=A0A2Z2M9P1_THEPR|nr:hypothetical protein [Thermococcus profundus]ASJ02466.1 hypothetical protein A3L09_03950 [Thermococcus profundus]
MNLVRSLLKLLFLHIPRLLFQIAGLTRVVRRGRRAFKRALKKEGLPEEIANVLTREFFVDINWRELVFKKERN